MGFRPEFLTSLELLACAFEALEQSGRARPVVVGGAAVEFWTGGEVTTGDFDVATPHQKALEDELLALGFEKRGGLDVGGFLSHPQTHMAVEVVSSSLFDGRADSSRVRIIDLQLGAVAVVSIEDIIADRMGQFVSTPQGVPEMKVQAIMLAQLAVGLDLTYLDRRIQEESSGDLGYGDLADWLKE